MLLNGHIGKMTNICSRSTLPHRHAHNHYPSTHNPTLTNPVLLNGHIGKMTNIFSRSTLPHPHNHYPSTHYPTLTNPVLLNGHIGQMDKHILKVSHVGAILYCAESTKTQLVPMARW